MQYNYLNKGVNRIRKESEELCDDSDILNIAQKYMGIETIKLNEEVNK